MYTMPILQMRKLSPVKPNALSKAPRHSKSICVSTFFRSELLSLLKTYNCYHEGRSFQLRHREVRPISLLFHRVTIYPGLPRIVLLYTC